MMRISRDTPSREALTTSLTLVEEIIKKWRRISRDGVVLGAVIGSA
jgi:hypothetical protein